MFEGSIPEFTSMDSDRIRILRVRYIPSNFNDHLTHAILIYITVKFLYATVFHRIKDRTVS